MSKIKYIALRKQMWEDKRLYVFGIKMRTLVIKNFSCIKDAKISVTNLTLLIGAQASGKSVISKLLYFFQNITIDKLEAIEDDDTFAKFKERTKEKFLEWFPVESLGDQNFVVEFCSGPVKYKVTRVISKKHSTISAKIWMSEVVENNYNLSLDKLRKLTNKTKTRKAIGDADDEADDYEYFLMMRNELRRRWSSILADDFISSQTFIPAGRSFFTSIGKTLVAFDQAGMLDPITKIFGRRYTVAKERFLRSARMPRSINKDVEGFAKRNEKMANLLGGNLKEEREKEYLIAKDGRRIPISNLSSGQQELLPLLIMIDNLSTLRTSSTRAIFIEEPEAHLFPSAQSKIIELLVTLTQRESNFNNDLFITTHSPYVLAKINNLIKAGQLGAVESDAIKVGAIVPKNSWVSEKNISAYAIIDGKVVSIFDDGLINAEYLDDVSGEISREFSALLEIEMDQL